MPQVLVDGQYGKDIAKYLQIPYNKLKTKVERSDSEEILVDIVSLIYKLEWDSSFFKSNIAFLSSICLTKNIENSAHQVVHKVLWTDSEWGRKCVDTIR